ncbi:S-adenosyl-L-methionine-dependent methyltransferase [Hyaloraphidium curvatum]|nr:S-adenosyl-L-methionine-dependent methyltransferase [Hyaloraphidium curvatum]
MAGAASIISLPRPSSAAPGGGPNGRQDEVRSFFNTLALAYDKSTATRLPIRERGVDILEPARGEHVLEIGYGTGNALIQIARAVGKTGRVTGLDISGQMAKIADEKLRSLGYEERADLKIGDAMTVLPSFPPGAFDAVFSSFVLELLTPEEISAVLSEVRRVLKPGGRIVVVSLARKESGGGGQGGMGPVWDWMARTFPAQQSARPIWAWRALEEARFEVKKIELTTLWEVGRSAGLPVDIVLAQP